MKKCEQCGHLNLDDAPYCGNCGAKLEVVKQDNLIICPNCGRTYTNPSIKKCMSCGHTLINNNQVICSHCSTANSPNAKYCSSCGRPLSKEKPGIKCIKCGSVNDIGNEKCVVCGTPLYEKQNLKLDLDYRSQERKQYRKPSRKHEGVLKNIIMIALFVAIIVSLFLPFYSLNIDGLKKTYCAVDNMSYSLRRIGYSTVLYDSNRLFNLLEPITEINTISGKFFSAIGWIFIGISLICVYQIVRYLILLFRGVANKEENASFLYLTIIVGIVSSLLFLFAYNAGQANIFGKFYDYFLHANGHDVILGLFHGTFVTAGICLLGFIVSFIGNKRTGE